MSRFAGYRTIAFAIVVLLTGLIGRHIAPEVIDHWLDVIFAAVAVGISLLRLATTTPVFATVAADIGIDPADIAEIKAAIAALPDMGGIGPAVSALSDKVDTLAGRPVLDPDVVAAITTLAAAAPSPLTTTITVNAEPAEPPIPETPQTPEAPAPAQPGATS